MKVAVLGCSGGMGSLFTRYFLERGYEVAGFDIRRPKRLPAGFRFAWSNADAVTDAEFVLVAVPLWETVRTVDEVLPFMKQGSTLVEITSVKGRIQGELRAILGHGKLSLLSLHPLFGPLARVNGSRICVVGSSRDMSVAMQLFPEARLIRVKNGDHDRMMAYVLSMVHLMNMAFVSALTKGIGVKQFEGISTPLASAQVNLSKAVLSSNPTLLSQIHIDNPFVTEMLSSLSEELEGIRKMVAVKDMSGFARKVSLLVGEFKRADLDEALRRVYS